MFLADREHLAYNVKEIYDSIADLGAFRVSNNRVFFRPAILNFHSGAKLFGRVADFYSENGPSNHEGMKEFLNSCTKPSVGKSWDKIRELKIGTKTCGERFTGLVQKYRKQWRIKSGSFQSRVMEKVGDYKPVKAIVSTSVLTGKAIGEYQQAMKRYRSGDHRTGEIPFNMNFDDLKFGYWADEAVLKRAGKNEKGYTDAKAKKFLSLGDARWLDVLKTSPAEPGLSPLVPLPGGLLSAGGWSDLAPVHVLQNSGCQRVVYITRRADESHFLALVAVRLGMTEKDWQALYDFSDPKSANTAAISNASAVWCTNWNAFKDHEINKMAVDSYQAPMEVRDNFFRSKKPFDRPYSRISQKLDFPGCTPMVNAGAKFPTLNSAIEISGFMF